MLKIKVGYSWIKSNDPCPIISVLINSNKKYMSLKSIWALLSLSFQITSVIPPSIHTVYFATCSQIHLKPWKMRTTQMFIPIDFPKIYTLIWKRNLPLMDFMNKHFHVTMPLTYWTRTTLTIGTHSMLVKIPNHLFEWCRQDPVEPCLLAHLGPGIFWMCFQCIWNQENKWIL